MQGKGALGSVVKARNKIDSRIYAGLSDLSNSPLQTSCDTIPPGLKTPLGFGEFRKFYTALGLPVVMR